MARGAGGLGPRLVFAVRAVACGAGRIRRRPGARPKASLALLVAVAAVAACGDAVPHAGELPVLEARLPERVETRVLAPGSTLGAALAGAGLEARDRNAALLAFSELADPRRLRSGALVHVRWRGAPETLAGVDVAVSRDRTVRLKRDGTGWSAAAAVAAVVVDTLSATGVIETMLWSAIMELDALAAMPRADRGRLLHQLDQVFQWQVDFSRQIRVGDSFRFVLEREVREDGTMRSGRLLAAELVNEGRAHHAVWFDPNGDGDGTWYDLEGRSVRRAFLRKPLDFRRISSRFSPSRRHPVLGTWRAHRGVDYAADAGTPVMSTGAGVVVRRGWSDTYGRVVDVRHPNGFLTRYAHLSSFRRGVAVGSRVTQGEVVGFVGMSGLATGPHLHYEMHAAGRPVDPLAIELPAGDPVPSANRAQWERESGARLAMLFALPGPEAAQAGPAGAVAGGTGP